MSKQNYDSKFCGSLPISFVNQIQDYGFLLVCDPDLVVLQASDNTEIFTGISYLTFPDKNLQGLLTRESFVTLQDKLLDKSQQRFTFKAIFTDTTQPFLSLVHVKEEYILLEFEPVNDGQVKGFREIYQSIHEASGKIQQSQELNEALSTAVDELKVFSGFDKVMIYKFDEDWNGHVLAEAMEPGMESYFGITFPASDIPKQARELYLKNPYRLIPDIEYEPSKLYPVINPLSSGFVDLSDCNLRGVIKVHLEYLSNMQVKSSMSTRILKDNKLWGLIACHHRERKFLNYDGCSVFEMFSSIISTRLSAIEIQQNLNKTQERVAVMNSIIEDVYSHSMLINAIDSSADDIMQLLDCTGLAHVSESKIKCYGACPAVVSIHELIIWLQMKEFNTLFSTVSLSEAYEDASAIASLASGLLAFPVIPAKGEYILCFRAEILQRIDWGGNPNEAIQFNDDMKTYHPRYSFEVWKEEIKNTSQPFQEYEINFAKELQRVFIESRLKEQNRR
jgi:chemotaxis family two-component system sensor kinase Cph1